MLKFLIALILPFTAQAGLFSFAKNKVVKFEPSGTLETTSVQVRAEFKSPVKTAVGTLDSLFEVLPPLQGQAWFTSDKVVTFVPAEPMKPNTEYTVRLHAARLRSDTKFSEDYYETKFKSPAVRVVQSSVSYEFDAASGVESGIFALLVFNYPVEIDSLKKSIRASIGGTALKPTLERGSEGSHAYIKFGAAGLAAAKNGNVNLEILTDLFCKYCNQRSGKSLNLTMSLPEKQSLAVKEFRFDPRPRNSVASVLFTMPVSVEELRANLTITPAIPVKIETEYAFAVLTADFEADKSYTLTIKSGTKSRGGAPLMKEYRNQIYVNSFPPQLSFPDEGHLLSAGGAQNVAVKSMNVKKFKVRVEKVFRNNLLRFLRGGPREEMGSKVWEGDAKVDDFEKNREKETVLSFSKWQQSGYRGVFLVKVNPIQIQEDEEENSGGYDEEGNYYRSGRNQSSLYNFEGGQSRWILVTDTGLLAKRSGKDLWVQALKLKDLAPAAGVQIRLISHHNQVMQSKATDAEGRVNFKNYTEGPEGGRATLLTAENGEDFSFLDLERGTLSQDRFDTGGEEYSKDGMEAWLSSDRGLYRPGDKVNFTAIVRRKDLSLPQAGLPLRLILKDPQGKEVAKIKQSLPVDGLMTFTKTLDASWTTGSYYAELGLENQTSLGSTQIKIEEFIPNKIKVEVAVPKVVGYGEALTATVEARMLFGASAPGLTVKPRLEWRPRHFTTSKFPGFVFADESQRFDGETLELEEGKTDDQGRFAVDLKAPDTLKPPSMLEALVYAEVLDDGGRPVGNLATVPVHVYPYYLGLKKATETVKPGTLVSLEFVAVDKDGKTVKVKGASLSVRRKAWYSIFRRYSSRGSQWESSFYEEPVLSKELDVDGPGKVGFLAASSGEYVASIASPDGMRASFSFSVERGGEEDASNLEGAETLKLSLEKPRYKAGETARLKVQAPFAGRLVVSVEREKVYSLETLEVKAGLNIVPLQVSESWQPNVYAVGLLTRAADEKLRNVPRVSFGILNMSLDTSERELKPAFDMPEETGSRDGLNVKLRVKDAAGAKAVIAVVDEGILQVINFQLESPHGFFYRKRGLSTATWSQFEQVLPELLRKAAVGGDEEAAMKKRHLNPIEAKRVKSFAHFSGILPVGEGGLIEWKVPTKGFQGAARVMVILVDGPRLGAGSRTIRIADEVVVESSFPRFLAPKDEIRVPVNVFNRGKAAKTLTLGLDADGPVKRKGGDNPIVVVEAGASTRVSFQVTALNGAGKAEFRVFVTEEGKTIASQRTELAVRPAASLESHFESGRLKPGEQVKMKVPSGFIPQGQKIRLTVSGDVLVKFQKSLEYLMHYPYGCAEQLTSQVFPLLYVKDMGLLEGKSQGKEAQVAVYVQSVLERLPQYQAPDGGFDYWQNPTKSVGYLTRYVAHFLYEAEKQGYKAQKYMMERLKERLKQNGGDRCCWYEYYDGYDQGQAVDDPYLLMIKALAGIPDKETMLSLKKDKLGKMNFSDRCHLANAFNILGDKASARAVLPMLPQPRSFRRPYGGIHNSPNIELALYLEVAAGIDPLAKSVGDLVELLGNRQQDGHYGSTHDNAWVFKAVARAVQGWGAAGDLWQAEWGVLGETAQVVSGKTALVHDSSLSGKTVYVKNTGRGLITYSVLGEGTPLEPRHEDVNKGIKVRRSYRAKDGSPLDLGHVRQGDLAVVTLEMDFSEPMDNVAIVDLLPAGFEIDNPRLQSRGSLSFDPPSSFSPASADYRDDRVLLFTRDISGKAEFSYSVRAVTPGRYAMPGLLVEAMYNPDVYGREDKGGFLVVEEDK